MKETDELLSKLQNSADINSLNTYLNSIEGEYPETLNEYLKMLLKEKKCKPSELIKKSKIERTYCYQILNGRKKPGRDKLIAIALALNLSLEETQRMLEISKEGVLYAKSKRDSIIIFALNHQYTLIDSNELLSTYGEEELK